MKMELCRICLSENTDKNVFSLPNELQVEKTVQEVMMFCLNIELCEDSKYDKFLCNNCHCLIISFYKFKVLALQSDKHLKTKRRFKTEDRKLREIGPDELCESGPKEKDTLSYESGHYEVEIKQEIDEFVVKCEKFYDDSDDNFKAEFTSEIEPPEVNKNPTKDKVRLKKGKKATGPQKNSVKVEGGLKKECQVCGKSVKLLQQHMMYNHTAPKKRRKLCIICNKRVLKLGDHMTKEHSGKPFACEQCPKSFAKQSVLKLHVVSCHTTERAFECEHCGRRYKLKGHLQTHIHTIHEEKKFLCQMCSKTFAKKSHLNDHLISHGTERKFKCEVCKKLLKTAYSLRSHMLRHEGVKKHFCTMCDKRFFLPGELHSHMLSHSDEKRYQCRMCDVRYRRPEHRRRHERTAHLFPTSINRKTDIPSEKNVRRRVRKKKRSATSVACATSALEAPPTGSDTNVQLPSGIHQSTDIQTTLVE